MPSCLTVGTIFTSLGLLMTSAVAASEERSIDATYERVRDFDSLCEYVAELAETPFQAAPELPPSLKELDYDDYRLISFWPNEAVWRRDDTPFQLELFHRGYIFFERVRVNLIGEDGKADRQTFDKSLYEYRGKVANKLELPRDLGYAGVKMLGTLPSSNHMQEVASFLGASYFRCLSDGQVYGASARGLGVNMGMNKPEEFPCFRDFWIFEPPADGTKNGVFDGPFGESELHFLAVLDSPSLTGAYEFRLRPGSTTACDVRAKLFFRSPVDKLCVAPMSSMWMWGKGRSPDGADPRPEVHDSDGLLTTQESGERTWRALAKQSYPSVSSQKVTNLTGFGLMQRERNYDRYRDDEAKYHVRPSVWIEPLSVDGEPTSWPAGWVELFEMPADHEGYDNIASWFVPERKTDPMQPFEFRYRVSFPSGSPEDASGTNDAGLARATDMTINRDGELMNVTLTFEGPSLRAVKKTSFAVAKTDSDATAAIDASGMKALRTDVSALRGSIRSVSFGQPQDGRAEVTFSFQADGDAPVELRASLRDGDRRLTETWSYLCPPHAQ